MNAQHLHTALIQFRISFLAYFAALTDDDLAAILRGPSETLLEVLQLRYGYTREQAKAEWNEFVLRHMDGPNSLDRSQPLPIAQRGQLSTRPPGKLYPSLWPPYASCWWRPANRCRRTRQRFRF
jgi:hypothetical protein